MSNDKHFRENEGDAVQSDGPGATALTGPNAQAPAAGQMPSPPIAPAHTPLPWKIDPTYTAEVQTMDNMTVSSCWEASDEGKTLGINGVMNCSGEESEANAAFIVRACNSFYDMRDVLNEIEGEPGARLPQALWTKLRAAISKATQQ